MRSARILYVRRTPQHLATPTSSPTISSPFRLAPIALLPPIPLYRRLFRAHRHHLPPDERILGDNYIKSEFRAHRKIDNPVHIVGFLTEWQLYAQKLEGEEGWRGTKLEKDKLDRMSDEQIGQLYELMKAIQGKEEPDGS